MNIHRLAVVVCTLLAWASAAAEVFTVSSQDVPKNIPDVSPAGVTSVLSVPNSGTILDLNLRLTVSHTCLPDLEITLTPPGGTPIRLLAASVQGGWFGLFTFCDTGYANFNNAVFDDQAPRNLFAGSTAFAGTGPFSGSYNLNHSSVGNDVLANINGRSAAGQWTLKVTDYVQDDVGALTAWSLTITTSDGPTGLRFVPLPPCRLADTREAAGTFGQPALAANTPRSFPIAGRCGLPANAAAYSLNATVVPPASLGFLTIWPTGTTQPFVSTLNSLDGRIKANAAIIPAGTGGAISVFGTDATHLVLDVNGYFIDPGLNAQSLAFYPITPCRVADTRNANGALGGPAIGAGANRDFPVLSSNCGVPANAQAYSLNATVVPTGPLGYLTLWPTGQSTPFVSTLNALTGGIVANAAIVPAGTNGSISGFASGPSATNLVLDINGYFAPAGAANAQRFFTVAPCRLLDTRNAAGEFGGPILGANQARSYRLPLANCNLPGTAAAFSLNATVVPAATLGFLTLWPAGSAQPFVSTLNALNDAIVANAAIVPAGTAGGVSSFVTDQTHLIVDTNGYFAP